MTQSHKKIDDLLEKVRALLQSEATRVCKDNGFEWILQVDAIRSEDGYFRAKVIPTFNLPTKAVAGLSVSSIVIRAVCAEVEASVEEKYQGLRIQLEAPTGKSAVKAKKAS